MTWHQAGSQCDCAGERVKRPLFFLQHAVAIRCLGMLGMAIGLAGCATYKALPLPSHASLAPTLSKLDLSLPPREPGQPAATINPAQPLTPDQIARLAMVNNPDLAVLRSKIAVAGADLYAARLLPNPSVGLSYASLISGPGTADAVTASISQDIQSIITYRPRVEAARARVGQVSADSLWQEWQVAQKARLLAIGINADDREIELRTREYDLLSKELKEVEQATQAGNLDLAAEAPLIAAATTAQRDLAAAGLQRMKDWQDLDALLGLDPSARFEIAAPEPVQLPKDLGPLLASLSSRRPDLVALRLGYRAAEADTRAAILGQFPAFSLGVAGGSDTSEVVSLGPQITFDLPIFNHNQAKIASARATRLQLQAEYQTRLNDAEGTAKAFLSRAHTAEANLETARQASAIASRLLAAAQRAYQQGNIDQRSLADYETTALDRQLDVLGYDRTLQENALGLSVELGMGFPRTIFGPADGESGS
jgi:outer membrane protein, heavy metal efflux system